MLALRETNPGDNHSLAVDKDGWIWVWGENGDGQLGLGDDEERNRPARIESINLLSYPPSVSVTNPAHGLMLTNAAGRLALGAQADDLDGAVARVEFFVGTNSVGVDTAAPWAATWTNLLVGAWTITAKATDNKGVSVVSAPVVVNVFSDGDTLGDAWEQLHFGSLEAAPEGDADGDGLSNEEEEALGTRPGYFDTDQDLLSDRFEANGGLNPNQWTDPRGDADGDGLSNLDEQIYGTKPKVTDSDGDGTSDGAEIENGGDANDPGDGGQAPPPEDLLEVELSVGDDSGSHSERYVMTLAGRGAPTIRHQAPEFGKVATRTYKLRRGVIYTVTLSHAGTDPEYDGEPKPDYDYTAGISPVEGQAAAFFVEDPEGMLGTHGESEEFFAAGRNATLILPRVVAIRASSAVANVSEIVFPGETNYFGDPCAEQSPGPALVVFHDSVVDQNLNVVPFTVTLTAFVEPASMTENSFSEFWLRTGGPYSGSLAPLDTFETYLINPTEGGLYTLDFVLRDGIPASGANVLLPLAGAEIIQWLDDELEYVCDWGKRHREAVENDNYSNIPFVTRAAVLRVWVDISATFFDYVLDPVSESRTSPCRRFQPFIGPNGDYGYVTLNGVVVHGSKVNNLLWSVFGRSWGWSRVALQSGAHLNQLARSLRLDGDTSTNAIILGSKAFDNRGADIRAILTKGAVRLLRDPSALDEERLWPALDLASDSSSIMERPWLPTIPVP